MKTKSTKDIKDDKESISIIEESQNLLNIKMSIISELEHIKEKVKPFAITPSANDELYPNHEAEEVARLIDNLKIRESRLREFGKMYYQIYYKLDKMKIQIKEESQEKVKDKI